VEILKVIAENYGTILILFTAAFGLIVKCRRYLKNAIRSVVFSNRFHVIFGEDPAAAVKAIHEAIQTSYEICELRQQITERHIKIGIFICDTEGRTTWTNDYCNALFSLDSKDMRGFGWLQGIAQSDRQRVMDHWLYCIKNDILYENDYIVINKKDHITIDVTATAVAVKDEHEKVQCYVGYLKVNEIVEMKKEDNAHIV
jgi:PAS domain-containing protein